MNDWNVQPSEGYCKKCGQPLGIGGQCYCDSMPDLSEIFAIQDRLRKQHLDVLIPIAETWGYGATMAETQKLWEQKDPIGCFTVGPCKGTTVPCGCDEPHKCDWCCGSGWLTKHVKQVKDSIEKEGE